MALDDEIWKPVVDWEGLYEVSSHGRVRSLDREIMAVSRWGSPQRYHRAGKILSPKADRDGYFEVQLVNGNRRRFPKVHQLVCEAFHGERPSASHVVAHGDGVRTNCHMSNLRWATHKENHADRVIHGTDPKGERHGRAKLDWGKVAEVRRRSASGERLCHLAREFGVAATTIGKIVHHEHWKAA